MNKKITISLTSILAVILGIIITLVSPSSKEDDPDGGITAVEVVTSTSASSAAESIESTAPAEAQSSAAEAQTSTQGSQSTDESVDHVTYRFRSQKLLDQHYKKHGEEMGFASAEEYEAAASDVINSPDALYKVEAEDGDGVYYIEATNEFVILSTDGYIRTYFLPSGGKSYFDRQ